MKNEQQAATIDLIKLAKHLLKYCWLMIICAAIGFGGRFYYAQTHLVDTYTASATMYVYNANPNMVNYSYTSSGDLSSAVQLLSVYKVVINSNKVMDVVVERLVPQYPDITIDEIIESLEVGSVNQTGVMRISCTTLDPQKSTDICNAVVDVAPSEIIRVVGAGGIEVVDYAEIPLQPNHSSLLKDSLMGGVIGGVLAAGILVVMFLLNQKVRDVKELTDNYPYAVLAEIPRKKEDQKLLIDDNTPSNIMEAYNKLRMNLGFSLVGKRHILLVSSAVPSEGKSTIAANLAITYAHCGKKVLLVDGDMRRANQSIYFAGQTKKKHRVGLSNVIIQEKAFAEVVKEEVTTNLDVLLAGNLPPNPSELLSSKNMSHLLDDLEKKYGYDIIIIDTPPINVVPDPLILAGEGVSMLYVVRQNFSDHRDVHKALAAVEFSKMDLLGLVLYGEKVSTSSYSKYKYYKYGKYYDSYSKTRSSVYGKNGERDEKWDLRTDKKPLKTPEQWEKDRALNEMEENV